MYIRIYIYSLYMQMITLLHCLIVFAVVFVTMKMIYALMVAVGREAEGKKVRRSWR